MEDKEKDKKVGSISDGAIFLLVIILTVVGIFAVNLLIYTIFGPIEMEYGV